MRPETSLARVRRRVGRHAIDLVIMIVLSSAAYVVRRSGRPWDGLWYDDAWVAGGAVFGSVGDVATTGGAHPGFTMLLWLQHHVVGGPVERLAWFPFVVGVLGPAILYCCLRSLRYGRASSLLAASAVVVTYAHIIYSGHVKPYTLDVVVVMGLAALLPRLARRRWTWWGAVGWVGFAVVVGSLSGYQMLASALAIGILVIHSCGDRMQRVSALLGQGLIQGSWVLYTRQFVDMDEIEAFMGSGYDAHVERSRNPITLGANVFEHLSRVVDVHPGPPAALVGLVTVGVVVGLVLGALGRLDNNRALVSQFALASLIVAAIGGVLHRFPFGPSTHDLATVWGAPGARHTLWLIPATSIGLCNLIDWAIHRGAKRPRVQMLVRGAVVLATLFLVTSRWEPVTRQGVGGARHLGQVTDAAAEDGAYIVLDQATSFTYLLLTDRPVRLLSTPEEMVGYLPSPVASQGIVLGPVFTQPDIAEFLATTHHQKLVLAGLNSPYDPVMKKAGWKLGHTETMGAVRVAVWRR